MLYVLIALYGCNFFLCTSVQFNYLFYISVIVFIKPKVPGVLVNFEPQSVAGWIADGCYCGVFVGDE